jgi:apolipoprotein N-acyltransferase
MVSVAAWFHLLMTDTGRGVRIGWFYGLGLYGVGVSWVYVSIHEHGNASPALAGALVALFVSGMALFPLLNGWVFNRVRSTSWTRSACAFVILLLGFEWLLTWFLTGFPWLSLGYGQIDSLLAGFAPVGGVALVSGMTAASALALLLWGRMLVRKRTGGWVFLGIGLAPWLLGGVLGQVSWTEPGASRTAALVQGNVAQETKWEADMRLPIVARYRTLSEPHWDVDLMLWPEAAITAFEHQAQALLDALDQRASAGGAGLILGLPAVEVLPGNEYEFLNTAMGLGTAQGRYVKRRLVPFGEYVPLESLLRGLIRFFDLPMSHAASGDWQQQPLTVNGSTANMAICYEIVYPELVRAPVDVLLTISNDTWFGDSIGPQQHLAIARMRALENGRWLLRATNNGITAIVDHQGRVRARLPQFEAGVLRGEYRLMNGLTPFGRFGPWPLYGLLLGFAVVLSLVKKTS